ncbi:BatA domain-containing protein [Sphingobium sp.]|uniref:BatA domain-containing protein n=1 Tax=Sphingobium sp. TaxID=1912891 RepID=UPI003BB5516C
MTLGLLIPAALAALVALVVPLAIHIARKSEQLRIDFAALRWLRQKPKPRSRLRFDEWPLLLLRLAIVTLVVLALARPFLSGPPDRTPYLAIVPGSSLTQTGVDKDSRAHWIAPGFPSVGQPAPSADLPTASLIRDLDSRLPADTPLTIMAPRQITGADAERMRLSRKVEWRIVEGAGFHAPSFSPASAIALAIRHDDGHRNGLRYFRAAALAWKGTAPDVAALDAPLPARSRSMIWLGGGTVPNSVLGWVKAGGTSLIASDAIFPSDKRRATLWRDALDTPLVEGIALGQGRLLRFTRRLTPTDMPELVESDFPEHLHALLSPPVPPSRALAEDYAPKVGGRSYSQPPEDLRNWLALLIALLFAAERWLATRRSRSISP